MTTQALTHVVDSSASLCGLIDAVKDLRILYLDLEGCKLGRYGSVTLLTLYAEPTKTAYIVDIYQLGKSAFTTGNSSGITLQSILESHGMVKVIFDVRNDSDALFSHFDVSLNRVEDLQLMELAARQGSRKFVAGLAKCIEKHSPINSTQKAKWRQQKEKTVRLFDPSKGGQYEVFNRRPILPDIREYCLQDVALLPGLYHHYSQALDSNWRDKILTATIDRIRLSQSPSYNPQGDGKAFGPWEEKSMQPVGGGRRSYGFGEYDDWDQSRDFIGWNDDDDNDDWYQDTARDCIGWEEDMIRHGSPF